MGDHFIVEEGRYEREARQLGQALSKTGGLVTWRVDATEARTGKLVGWCGDVKEAMVNFRVEARLQLRDDGLKCYLYISRDLLTDATVDTVAWIRNHMGDAIGQAIMTRNTAPVKTEGESD